MSEQRVLDGRYEVGELLGRGGMADVHLGRDVRLGRAVAIKLLRPDLARDPQFRSRFRREAQAVAALNHPSIVSVYDTGAQDVTNSTAEPLKVPFIVMEYVAGRTLRDLVRSKEINIDRAIEHTLGVLSALEYSHRAGIVHRDIKPANVMVTPDGAVKVMDFGIARAMADSAATMTQTQAVIGTAQYLSPEQARGETVDARSDLYSAACLLYEMLTGRPPFVGDSPVSVAYQHVREVPEPPSRFNAEVSPALDSVLARALQKNRQERFQDAAAFRRALRAARSGVALTPAAPTVPDQDTQATAVVPALTEQAGGRFGHTPANETQLMRDTLHPDAGPQTRAMAKVMAGGPLTTGESDSTDTGSHEVLRAGSGADDHERNHHNRSRRRAWTTTLVLALLLVLGVGGYLLYSSLTAEPPPAATVEVPSVENLSEAEALTALYRIALTPDTTRVEHDDVAAGQAIRTDPAAGTLVEVGGTVKLMISTGPSSVQIPENLQGQTEAAVRDRLGQAGLRGGETTSANSATVPEGQLIATEPALGQDVAVGSTVDLIISTGRVAVPQLTEKSREDAEAALDDPAVNLPYEIELEENSAADPGTVTAQSEPAGSEVDQGTLITLTVAEEPAEEPTSPPEPEESDPPEDEPPAEGAPPAEGSG